MKQLVVVAGLVKLKNKLLVLMLLTLKPFRLALAAKIVTLVALLATLLVVGVRDVVPPVTVPDTETVPDTDSGVPLTVETL